MREFVEDDVIRDLGRQLDQAPVEGNGLPGRTGTPARTLVAHVDSLHGELMERGQLAGPWREFETGERPEGSLDAGTQVGFVGTGLWDPEGAQLEEGSVLGMGDCEGFATKPHGGAEAPFQGRAGSGGPGLESGDHPRMMLRHEILRLGA